MTTKSNVVVQGDELERKTLVAKQRIKSIHSSLEDINEVLKQICKELDINLNDNQATTKVPNTKVKSNPDYFFLNKKRNKLDITPKSLWFKMHGMYFYIEFTIRCAKNDEKHLEGCFIYGMSYYIEKDKVEDKPIVSFIIDEHEIITANNE